MATSIGLENAEEWWVSRLNDAGVADKYGSETNSQTVPNWSRFRTLLYRNYEKLENRRSLTSKTGSDDTNLLNKTCLEHLDDTRVA